MPPAPPRAIPAQAEPARYTQSDLDRQALALADAEQERLANRLHDTVCQSLSAVQFLAGLTARQLTRETASATQQLREIVQQLDAATAELQDLMAELRPAGLEHVDALPAALQETAQRFARTTLCEFGCPSTLPIRDLATADDLCRIFFSALSRARLRNPKQIEAELSTPAGELLLKVICDSRELGAKSAKEDSQRRDTLDRRVRLLGGTTLSRQDEQGRFQFEARIPAA